MFLQVFQLANKNAYKYIENRILIKVVKIFRSTALPSFWNFLNTIFDIRLDTLDFC